jgi:hypothetical protein
MYTPEAMTGKEYGIMSVVWKNSQKYLYVYSASALVNTVIVTVFASLLRKA